jgi:hypothetical protein
MQSTANFWKLPEWLENHIREARVASQQELAVYESVPAVSYVRSSIQQPRPAANDHGSDNEQDNADEEDDHGDDVHMSPLRSSNIVLEEEAAQQAIADVLSRQSGRRARAGAQDDFNADVPSWGAPFCGCKKDHFAMVSCTYAETNGRGVSIYKITSVDSSAETFTGKEYVFQAKRGVDLITNQDRECLDRKWMPVPRAETHHEHGYNVLRYFKLTGGGRIPKTIKTFVDNWDNEHENEPIFQAPDDEEQDQHSADDQQRQRSTRVHAQTESSASDACSDAGDASASSN